MYMTAQTLHAAYDGKQLAVAGGQVQVRFKEKLMIAAELRCASCSSLLVCSRLPYTPVMGSPSLANSARRPKAARRTSSAP